MKIIPNKLINYDFTLKLTKEEAIRLVDELGKIKQELDYNRAIPTPKSINASLYMVLSDCLQDLDLIPMTENRRKGDKSYPRLKDDEVVVEERK